MAENELRRAIETARSQGQLAEVLPQFGNYGLTNATDAEAVAGLVSDWSRLLRTDDAGRQSLRAVLGFFQQVETQEAFETLAKHGLPHVRDLFDALRDRPSSPERSEDLLFATKILVLYHDPADLPRIADAARDHSLDHEPLWSVIFQSIGEGYPLQAGLLEALRESLPRRSAGLAYLDWVNGISAERPLDHPFDTEAGRSMLRDWLSSTQPNELIAARSAAAALPYLDATSSRELIQTAQQHPVEEVRLLAAFAAAKSGNRSAVAELARACLDVRSSATAVRHLESLGELNAIPVRAKSPDFMAAAELCRWLSHPMEFGRPPDEIELRDRRTLFWPPANEPRTLWLVRFRYKAAGPEGADETGIGLAGSITFALYGEANWDTPPEDVYALHCCWELEVEQDPRAPAQRSIAAGRELLRSAGNTDF
jgi:hypothetical protein